ncbi:sulfatase-like hydrolase/transferase [Bordetella genomosp. 9]|uniref:sulfatase-like hydrolase/transferase n=1 Tax=Bordetella genomosp. 9 TaxID=1416803 RepID=UPI0011783AF3|nr:sulfatase-like hydrolase/transferase [Bordetella genomosp. 9]
MPRAHTHVSSSFPGPTTRSASFHPRASRSFNSLRTVIPHGLPEWLILFYTAGAYLALDGFFAIQRFHTIGLNVQGHFGLAEYLRQGVFILEYLVAILALYAATRVRPAAGLLLLLLLWLLVTVDLSAHAVYGRPAGIGNISALNASAGMLDAALQEYGHLIGLAAGKAAILFVPLLMKCLVPRRSRAPFALLAIMILALGGMYGYILTQRGPPALIGFPKGFSYGFGSLATQANDLLDHPRYRPAHVMAADDIHDFRNVIVIVDESVEYTHFEQEFQGKGAAYADFGLAYSGGNCSAASNYILRKAWWPRADSGHVDIARTDSLFALARQRGYTTTYIDNQGVLDDPSTRNYINRDELADIDHVIANNGPLYERDARAAKQILARAATGRNFILINKDGAHFPYADYIPPASVSGDKVTDYRAAIRHNSADFLATLRHGLSADTIVFYTSDHGQNLTTRATHCNTGDEATAEEYRVPFLVLATDPAVQARLRQAALIQHDRLTHLEFSESVREALGYRFEGVKSLYAAAPIDTPFCGLYGSPKVFFGVRPACKPLPAPTAAIPPSVPPAAPSH